MKEAIVAPRQLVDINDSPGLDRIYLENGRLRIGALVRMSAAAAHADVVRQFPALAQAREERLRADPEHGDDGRQSAAANALSLFPG